MNAKLVREAIFTIFKTGEFVTEEVLTEDEISYIHERIKDYFGVCILGKIGRPL
jgi:hypothetical protein